MSDNPRPDFYGARYPVHAVREGAARPLVRRETTSDLLVRDIGL